MSRRVAYTMYAPSYSVGPSKTDSLFFKRGNAVRLCYLFSSCSHYYQHIPCYLLVVFGYLRLIDIEANEKTYMPQHSLVLPPPNENMHQPRGGEW